MLVEGLTTKQIAQNLELSPRTVEFFRASLLRKTQSPNSAALASALTGGWLAPGAMVVWEEDTAPLPPPGLTAIDQRRYGDTLVTLLQAGSEAGA